MSLKIRFCSAVASGMLVMALWEAPVSAIELSHYGGGLANVDDFFIPPPEVGQFLYAQYNFYYFTDTFRNADGDKVDSISFTDRRGMPHTIKLDLNIDQFFIAPALMWSPKFTVLGARYGAFAVIPIGNPATAAHLQTARGRELNVDQSVWDIGDCYFQPFWLMWSTPRLDAGISYGFDAPTGRYSNGASDNVGLGYFQHQVQGTLRVHLDDAKSLSGVLVPTFEIAQKKTDVDITPGEQFTLNWGLRKDFAEDWLQFAVLGYDTWQLTEDHGADATDHFKDEVHAAGFQIGIPKFGLAFKYLHEYLARDRFEGQMVSFTFGLPLDPLIDKIAAMFS